MRQALFGTRAGVFLFGLIVAVLIGALEALVRLYWHVGLWIYLTVCIAAGSFLGVLAVLLRLNVLAAK